MACGANRFAGPAWKSTGNGWSSSKCCSDGRSIIFGLAVRTGMTINDLACAVASLIEGVWLNQCLTRHHPCDPSEPIATVLRRAGRMLWLGATEPAGAR